MDRDYPVEVDSLMEIEMVDEVGGLHQKNHHRQIHQADLVDDSHSHLKSKMVFDLDQRDLDHQVVCLHHHLRVVKNWIYHKG